MYFKTVLAFFSSIHILTSGLTIEIDWKTGQNIESCRLKMSRCKTLSYALERLGNGSRIILLSGLQRIGSTAYVNNARNISIVGQYNSTLYCAEENAGLMFYRTENLLIQNLTFHNCGANFLSSIGSLTHFRSVIYSLNSSNLRILGVVFTDSFGIAVTLLNTKGIVVMNNCTFSGASDSKSKASRGLYIEYFNESDSACKVTIQNCTFSGNNNTDDQKPIGEGGALHLLFNRTSKSINITIEHCHFIDNMASIAGGAIAIKFYESSSNNHVQLRHCFISGNLAEAEGGGLKLAFNSMEVVNNSVIVDNVRFYDNIAKFGGGVAVKSIQTNGLLNKVLFSSCTWYSNGAVYAGSAAVFYPIFTAEDKEDIVYGRYIIPKFENVSFHENRIKFSSAMTESHASGKGTLFSDSIPINMSGNIEFSGNNGSAIFISSAHINILNDSNITLTSNIGVQGGGLALMHGSHLTMYEDTRITFERNVALDSGGAVFSDLRSFMDYFHLKHCFLRYYNPSLTNLSEWKTQFIFINNKAQSYGQTIYAASLKPCQSAYGFSNVTQLFTSTPFEFVPKIKKSLLENVSTDCSKISFSGETSLQAYPGLDVKMGVRTKDELNQTTNPVLLATCTESQNCPLPKGEQYISDNTISFKTTNSSLTFSLRLKTVTTRESEITIQVKLNQCPVGYRLDKDTCLCISHLLPGLLSCNSTQNQALMKVGCWVGCENGNSNNLLSQDCPRGYCNYSNKSAGDAVLLGRSCEDLESICSDNREGRLCGSCVKNYSVFYHSNHFRCSECHNVHVYYGILFYFLSEILPLTVFFLVVVIFDISLTSGPISSFVLFAQVLDIFDISYESPTAVKKMSIIYRFLFGFLNFDLFRLDEISFCIIENANTLDILAFKYITTLYSFLLICVLFILLHYCPCDKIIGKCRRKSSSTSSYTVINGVIAFMIISYSQCAKVSFEILTQETLHSIESESNVKVVLSAGHINYLSSHHLPYAIPAFVMILYLLFVPIALIAYPLYFMCKGRLSVKRFCRSSTFNLYIMPIMDAFQSPYKENARFFAGSAFLYRLIFCASFAFPSNSIAAYSAMELAIILILTVRTIFHPFRTKINNSIECLLFADLAIINGITLYNIAYESNFNNVIYSTEVLASLQFVLIFLPVIIAVFVTLLKALIRFKFVRDRLYPAKVYFNPNSEREQSVFENDSLRTDPKDSDPDEFPARMIDEEIRSKESTWTMVGVVNDERSKLIDCRRSYGLNLKSEATTY